MELYRVILMVTDIDRAARFYAEVFGSQGDRVSRSRHYFDCGGTILACYDPVADGDEPDEGWHPHFNQYLYFAVTDLESTFARVLSAGAEVNSDIRTYPWGEHCFYAKDPFGNPIAFVERSTVFAGDGYFN